MIPIQDPTVNTWFAGALTAVWAVSIIVRHHRAKRNPKKARVEKEDDGAGMRDRQTPRRDMTEQESDAARRSNAQIPERAIIEEESGPARSNGQIPERAMMEEEDDTTKRSNDDEKRNHATQRVVKSEFALQLAEIRAKTSRAHLEQAEEELAELKKKYSMQQVINFWKPKVTERMSAIDKERLELDKVEEAMAQKRRRSVFDPTVKIWEEKATTATKSEPEELDERQKILVKQMGDMWRLITDKSKAQKKIEEQRIQQTRFDEELAEKKRITIVGRVKRKFQAKVDSGRWKVEKRKRLEDIVEVVMAERKGRIESVESMREEERERLPMSEESVNGDKELPTVLTTKEALESCRLLGEENLLLRLNSLLGTDYGMSEEIQDALDFCISRNYDLGTTYGLLRGSWLRMLRDTSAVNPPRLKEKVMVEKIEKCQLLEDLQKQEHDMSGHITIANPYDVTPRRIWELHSNRVIPWECVDLNNKNLWAISHSWVQDSDRYEAHTAVNGYEWPVPLPLGITLESVRGELLRHEAEYCWLDVVCLRQKAAVGTDEGPLEDSLEQLRRAEWAIDVPTIGNIYIRAHKVLRYYNGLGRPFKIDGWDSDFHWTNRAWTLQESRQSITGGAGVSAQSLLPLRIEDGRHMGMTISEFESSPSSMGVSELLKSRASGRPVPSLAALTKPTKIKTTTCGLFKVLKEMKHRTATNDVDKVAGIGFLIWAPTLPAFSEALDVEEAWTRCVRHMTLGMKDELLFRFPIPGDQSFLWFPSWKQVQEHELPEDTLRSLSHDDIGSTMHYTYLGDFFQKAKITGLQDESPTERSGILRIESEGQGVLQCMVTAAHKHPIPDGDYSLVRRLNSSDMVVCDYFPSSDNHFTVLKKVSVIVYKYGDDALSSVAVRKSCKFV